MNERILKSVYGAVDQINEMREGEPLAKSTETPLFGSQAQLDSLGLINLIVSVEEHIEKEFGAPITLADDRALSQPVSPFRTIGSLVDYISLLLEASAQGEG